MNEKLTTAREPRDAVPSPSVVVLPRIVVLRRVDTALPRGFGSRPASRPLFSRHRVARVAWRRVAPLALATAVAAVLAGALSWHGPSADRRDEAATIGTATIAPAVPRVATPDRLAAAHVELMFGAPTAAAPFTSTATWSVPAWSPATAARLAPSAGAPAPEPAPTPTAVVSGEPEVTGSLVPGPAPGPTGTRAAVARPLLTPPPPVLAARPVTAVPRRTTAKAEAPAPVAADTRNFLQKLFGGGDAAAPAATLAYAPTDGGDTGGVRGLRTSPQDEPTRRLVGEKTAIYDISARAVIMPDGRRLEAHSGLGEHMDDIRSHRIKNRGVTPPNVYTLRMREQPFHGVRAIRLIPVDEGRMFGRDGILAHSYLLGPRGDSNGCVSFRDYDAFLAAFLRGEVNRIVVVESATSPRAFAAAGL